MTGAQPARCAVGIHVHAEPAALAATLAAVERTAPLAALFVLPDAPDLETAVFVARSAGVDGLWTDDGQGPASCFNRLAGATTHELLVLLESGALPGPGWLERLTGTLDADAGLGLVGPSTNRSWNEQGAFQRGTASDVAATAAEAARRYGAVTRDLGPLYSLADFCYVVRRAVVEDVGEMDERYGAGPCWEMDYTIRAARAGWRSAWAPGAYVYRSPFTARRAHEEARLFDANRRRYQDKFCGLRLSGQRVDYEPHCRGDACEHFAPVAGSPRARLAAVPSPARARPRVTVSCVMPTGGRPALALQAVEYFRRQQLEARELVVLDDGPDDLTSRLAGDERVRYVRTPLGQTIGAKRNELCRLARGDVVVHWDDDDWYGPGRLVAQVEPLLAGSADVTALRDVPFFDVARWQFWRCTPALHRKLFVGDVHGGTLAYRRSLWERRCMFPDVSLAEDAAFLAAARRRGARLAAVDGSGLCLYVRHRTNAWAFECGTYLDPGGWAEVPQPALADADVRFYRELELPEPGHRHRPAGARRRDVLVSCIMPTADRRAFLPNAIACFLEQDHGRKELVVVDDGDDDVRDLLAGVPDVRYVRLPSRQVLGAKRNEACAAATGEVIVHWDDDDWSAPYRISAQVDLLLAADAEVCGSRRLLYLDLSGLRAWRYEHPLVEPVWVAGNTLCYRTETWRRRPFREVPVGEDGAFVLERPAPRTVAVVDDSLVVGTVHAANASPKYTLGSYWAPCPPDVVRGVVGDAWDRLVAAGSVVGSGVT